MILQKSAIIRSISVIRVLFFFFVTSSRRMKFMASELLNPNPAALNSTIEFLTAMITPALLISATGSLVLSTSTRLGRVVDRVRELERRLNELITTTDKNTIPLYEKRLDTVVNLLDKVTTRSRILQRAMGAFYYGLGFFILTSVTIAVVGIFNVYRWMPIPVGIVGIVFLFYGSLLMLRETRMATATVNAEMDFTWTLAKTVVPVEIISRYAKVIDENTERMLDDD
jgi:threonine/homoserine/homoserine lactone efflux protein